LIGVGLVRQGRVAISLGTSDTLFGFMLKPQIDPKGVGHVFGSPTGDYMSLICWKNGSLARDGVRREHGLDWESFSRALRQTKPGNGGAIMLPWFEPEITPTVHSPGVRRYQLDPGDGPANVRAVIEAQMMSMAIHSQWMGVEVDTIHATAGAARNREILRIMADVHDADVYQLEVGNSACLGAALRALHGDLVSENKKTAWEDVIAGFTEPVKESRIEPIPANVALYAELKKVYSACESHAIRGGEDPSPSIEAFRKRFPR
jgi:xylulokinase